MPAIHETRVLPYSAARMFDLVADVARYPEFLPWVAATRVTADDGSEMVADMLVRFSAIREKFTSRVTRRQPDEIRVEYIDGPLKNLNNVWCFRSLDENSCEIEFDVRFAFRNALFEKIAGQFLDRAFRKMVAAFEARAAELYGSSSPSATSVA